MQYSTLGVHPFRKISTKIHFLRRAVTLILNQSNKCENNQKENVAFHDEKQNNIEYRIIFLLRVFSLQWRKIN